MLVAGGFRHTVCVSVWGGGGGEDVLFFYTLEECLEQSGGKRMQHDY